MRKSHSTLHSFNPEKILAADAKKKIISATSGRQIALRRVIALGDGFKKTLFLRLEKEQPELFWGGENLRKYAEAAGAIEEFLRSSIAREGLKFSDDMFSALHFNFLHELGKRSGDRKSDGADAFSNE